jgi:16S rRNA (cytosine967-C5)-methyltransferase
VRPRRRDPRPASRPVEAPGLAARRVAAELVEGVLVEGRPMTDLSHGLGSVPLRPLAPVDRARAQALAHTVLRHLQRLDWVLAPYLRKPPLGRARTALRLAAAEMLVDGVPSHAAVDAAVSLVRGHPKARHLAPLVNAVGRRVAEEGAGRWDAAPPPRLPHWLEGPIAAACGAEVAAAIAAAHGGRPSLDLTLRSQGEAADWARRLGAELLPTGSLRLAERPQVTALPGFAEGEWWVQDAAAALPARMLGPVAGMRVLDLCAAPGGKTLQLAAAGAQVTALDVSDARLGRLRENLERTGLAAEVVAADALAWEPEAPFDAIMLDAPCSATGTIRRHPDLPHVAGREDIAPLIALQRALLDRAWQWLTPGGRLVFATCSLVPAEGEEQIARFLAGMPGARQARPVIDLPDGWLDERGALRTRPDFWPGRGGVDGFFAALLVKAKA